MSKPFITILVPTRERCETLGPALHTCLDQDYERLEVIVSDNCSRDATREVVAEWRDSRLRYIRPDRRLSMSGNFEFALAHARPGFICSIGDDDGLMPGSVATVAEMVEKTGVGAVAGSTAIYYWPNFQLDEYRNRLVIRDSRTGVERYPPMEKAADAIALRRPYWYIHGLPSLYRGFISSEIIQRATREGRYFHSATPDAYSAFVNAFFLDEIAYSRRPLTIEGTSGRGNGASQMQSLDHGAEEAAYLAENDIEFHPDVTYAPDNCIILAEAFLQARAQFPERATGLACDLGRLCATAAWEARGSVNGGRVGAAVAAMRDRHGLPASTLPLGLRAQHQWGRLRMQLQTREIDCSRFGVHDVYGAAGLADSALQPGTAIAGMGGARYVLHKLAATRRTRRQRRRPGKAPAA